MRKVLGLILAILSTHVYSFDFIKNIEVTDEKQTIMFNSYIEPIVFSSVPTFNGIDAGVISISNVTNSSFDVHFKEWPYLDGTHKAELVSFLVLEKGRHQLSDGSVWEAGKFVINRTSIQQYFTESFTHTPNILLTGQTQNRSEAYAMRISSASRQTFGASIDGQELGTVNDEESVGYLAIYKDNNQGVTDQGLVYALTQQAINEDGYETRSGKLFVQEEQSKDEETTHLTEIINILSLNNQLFAQDITNYGTDPMALRLQTPSLDFIDGVSCEAIKQQDPSIGSGIYLIDPDGENGIAPFPVYCEMVLNGGGWTLVAYHKDGLEDIVNTSPVTLDSLGVLAADEWQAIRNNMSTGMMFIDEHDRISQISKSKLNNGNCVSIDQTNDLTDAPNVVDIDTLWHSEGSGCDIRYQDYSLINLNVKSTSWNNNTHLIAGASLYQFNIKFDLWPYEKSVSYFEQDELYYYVK